MDHSTGQTNGHSVERQPNGRWEAGGAFGGVIDEMYDAGHIPDRLLVSSRRFLHDLRREHGSSAGLVGGYSERIEVRQDGRLIALGTDFDAWDRIRRVIDNLNAAEAELFAWLVSRRELRRGQLADWGRAHSGCKTDKACTAFAAGQIRSLLESIAARI